ncbi:MAG: alanine racemase [Hydrogenophilales bacterium CG03_land_8_20_14_0_80_62_28]|nr:alanine racemase [Betaproteobacteria bacterium]OIO79672.1 MAG: alanine racemase [Hydrogenophilaceae bacterium CG1_02_62_390]PIV22185.1 MAG: alanine racemase [Hydrogenophilales bacterium CG03_land_8_20_14_0_80_62_28]PIW38929.1 MAG: alanine racemase [Hydrogenophilales bacterium CG15_BIG_FIL_POST_REV_8_21_14_020_62_31]PIW71497.1 MAG: alanine racemase [Hydrogenophilales bacterium CG12_big_fil_rev_8_21_14_0_65_61_21]PIX02269.1 MAG: alanine racemase [Hydrogenophilales bacterium CG_4_8_14_3_um_fil
MRPLVARIDSAALGHNLMVAKRLAGRARLLAVIKANAYGHGLLRAAQALRAADGFAVLTLDEAIQLRAQGYSHPIVLLEGFFHADEIPEIARRRLQPVIHRADQVDALARARVECKIDCFLKLDSGMHRLGLQPKAMLDALARLKTLPHIGHITLMSHFARADEGGEYLLPQLDLFRRATAGLSQPISLANSAALMRHPESLGDWVRPGIMLYGASPFASETGEALGLLPAMRLESEIIAIQPVRKGEGVGYGHLFTAPRDMQVGIVACGYADGYPRHAQTGAPVLVEGRLTRTLGRVSMDMLHVDLSDLGHAHVGSPVTLWGDGCPVEAVATAAGTISYELLTAITARVRIEET